ncbi:MAG: hypothetical protein HUJ90_03395, partial [Bacteroidales bacterium]|nr:hypothetical protein [Bacteroidales bacterium]
MEGVLENEAQYEARMSVRGKKEQEKIDREFDIKEKISNFAPEEIVGRLDGVFYDDNSRADRLEVVKYLQGSPEGRDVIDRLNRHNGKNWAKTAATATAVRMGLEDLLAGNNPRVGSFLTRLDSNGKDTRKALRESIKRHGANALRMYIAESNALSGSSKPKNSVNGSYLSCNPSDACAEFCYAAGGNQKYANSVIKSEILYWLVKNDPEWIAKRILREYQTTGEYDNGKALRLYDMGDLDEAWLPVIKYLNDNGVVTQIFTKNPEVLKQVDRNKNVVSLSIDATNAYLLEQYPDMPVALVYTGEKDLPLVERCKRQIEQYGGVILPVKKGSKTMPQKELNKLPDWTKAYQCPVDNGTKKIINKEYPSLSHNCTKCDTMNGNGVGCFFKRTSRILRELDNEINNELQRRGIDIVDYGDIIGSGLRNGEGSDSRNRVSAIADEMLRDSGIRNTLLRALREINESEEFAAANVSTESLEGIFLGTLRRLASGADGFERGRTGTETETGTAQTGRLEGTDGGRRGLEQRGGLAQNAPMPQRMEGESVMDYAARVDD